MFLKTSFKVAILVVFLISLCEVFGMPDPSVANDYSMANLTSHRNKRQIGGTVGIAAKAIDNLLSAPTKSSCFKSGCKCGIYGVCRCWAHCQSAHSSRTREWYYNTITRRIIGPTTYIPLRYRCYTTKSGYSQDRKYVRCSRPSDCDGCWKCAGPCTIWNRCKILCNNWKFAIFVH